MEKMFLIKIKDCAPFSFSILYKFIIPYNLHVLRCELRKKLIFLAFFLFFIGKGPYSHHYRMSVPLRLCINMYVNLLIFFSLSLFTFFTYLMLPYGRIVMRHNFFGGNFWFEEKIVRTWGKSSQFFYHNWILYRTIFITLTVRSPHLSQNSHHSIQKALQNQ